MTEEKKIYSELPDKETGFLYVVRGLKHFSDKYGRAYNSVWGTYYDPEEAKKHAKQSCETSYADEVILEEYELVTKTVIGSGVPLENRREIKEPGKPKGYWKGE